ncbi:hypothetical protein HJC23_009311 [Cyclotella cryptica]|uniref:Uncharacterized protein n=1 Tax=Cyclotella cryptica TaxID=29204 RepID=A0ABD3QT68_9STRA
MTCDVIEIKIQDIAHCAFCVTDISEQTRQHLYHLGVFTVVEAFMVGSVVTAYYAAGYSTVLEALFLTGVIFIDWSITVGDELELLTVMVERCEGDDGTKKMETQIIRVHLAMIATNGRFRRGDELDDRVDDVVGLEGIPRGVLSPLVAPMTSNLCPSLAAFYAEEDSLQPSKSSAFFFVGTEMVVRRVGYLEDLMMNAGSMPTELQCEGDVQKMYGDCRHHTFSIQQST